ncbi:MAG: hypothetical protein MdMp014T_2784 [Treponematales bacterium]
MTGLSKSTGETAKLRQELQAFITAIPARRLSALKPLLADMAETDDELIIETDLTPAEKAVIREGRKHYRKHPEDFFTLDYFLAHEDEFRPKKAVRARLRKPAARTVKAVRN